MFKFRFHFNRTGSLTNRSFASHCSRLRTLIRRNAESSRRPDTTTQPERPTRRSTVTTRRDDPHQSTTRPSSADVKPATSKCFHVIFNQHGGMHKEECFVATLPPWLLISVVNAVNEYRCASALGCLWKSRNSSSQKHRLASFIHLD